MSDLLPPGDDIRSLLRATLTERMRARDRDAVNALRSALAAIDNAEAVPAPSDTPVDGGSAHLAVPGGPAEAERRELSQERMRDLVAAQAQEFVQMSRQFGESGMSEPARVAFEQAAHLRFLLDVVADRDPRPGGD